jgi:hypothetical protein
MKEAEKIRLELANPLRRRKKIMISEVEEPVESKGVNERSLNQRARVTYGASRKNGK